MITCLGSIALDTTRTPNGCVSEVLGGSATYFSLSSSLFSETGLVSCIGGDFPQEFLNILSSRGIDLSGLQIVRNEKTMRYHSTFSGDYEHRSSDLTQLNVFEKFRPVLSKTARSALLFILGPLRRPYSFLSWSSWKSQDWLSLTPSSISYGISGTNCWKRFPASTG